jgi:fatty-acyl-CoA synthase
MDLGWITRSTQPGLPFGDRDKVALAFEADQHLTYGELFRRQCQYANGLLALGVGRGDRVGILMRNNLDYMVLQFAAARIGAISVRLNFRLTAPELQFALEDSGTSVLCMEPEFVERIESVADSVPTREFILFGDPPGDRSLPTSPGTELLEHGEEDPGTPLAAGSDPLMLMYTSGTTGFPKGVVWTHDTAIGCAISQALTFRYGPDTVAMTTGPLYHAAAYEVLLMPAMLCGGTAVAFGSGKFDIARVVEVANAWQVTDVMIFPFMLYDLLRLEGVDGETMPAMKRILTGGDPIMPWALDEARERFPAVEIVQGYGLTEATQSTNLGGEDSSRHSKSIGRPFSLKTVKVVAEDGAETAPGEPGEVFIRGAGVCREYWRRPEESARTFTDGWLHTGDMGQVTDGLLFLAGRKKDMIRSGGENISPAEVEAALTTHPDIADAAVVAIPDSYYTEVGCAVLVMAGDAEPDSEAITAYCLERLAKYKVPKQFVKVDELPRNASGKVLKTELRERYRHLGSDPTEQGAAAK